jgi:hypothetical protein
VKTAGSVKVTHDRDGQPWLIVGVDDGYEAHRLVVVERHQFRRSHEAVRFASNFLARLTPCGKAARLDDMVIEDHRGVS